MSRLDPRLRGAVYTTFSFLFLTGTGWVLADRTKDGLTSEAWQTATSYLLMLHGGAAMAALMLLGALVPLHARRCWRVRKNRFTGAVMLTFNGVLVATSFGLYYAGSEVLRPWISDIHIGFGMCLPVLVLAHILVGRRS